MRYKDQRRLDQIIGDPSGATWYACEDPETDRRLLIKAWHHLSSKDATLQLFWSRHVRQLQKLSICKSGRDYLLPVLDSWSDEDGFHLAFLSDGRLPIGDKRPLHSRRTTWRNLYRLACAVNTLHNAGFVHRQISLNSVFTDSSSPDADFQLGNFDWGVWLREPSQTEGPPGTYSFDTDWLDFAKLAITLLNLRWEEASRDYAGAGLRFEEFRVLRDLLKPLPSRGNPVESIERLCDAQEATGSYYYIGYNLKTHGRIWNSVDPERELNDDLDSPILRLVSTNYGLSRQLVLTGRRHDYFLKPEGITPGIQTVDHIRRRRRRTGPSKPIPLAQLRIINLDKHDTHAINNARTWWPESSKTSDSNGARELNALRSLLGCEVIWQLATTTWLVRLTSTKRFGTKFRHRVEIVSDQSRTQLNELLGLKAPEEELEAALTRPRFPRSSEWKVRRWPLDHTASEDWLVEAAPVGTGERVFVFTGRTRFEPGQQLELVSPAARGNEALARRKLRFLQSLDESHPLLKLIHDPLVQRQHKARRVPSIAESGLDDSKRLAVQSIERTPELFAVQGPPGVGKSFLLLHLIRRTLADHRASRILVTAHGQDTVNQFAESLESNISDLPEGLLIVRARYGTETHKEAFHIQNVLKRFLDNVRSSSAFADSPVCVQEGVASIPMEAGAESTLASLILASADILLTSTNSRDVEEGTESNSLFDWVIVEEAGRASGTDLIGPLLLSNQRLLVGDSNQLPPFGERQLRLMLQTKKHFRQITQSDALAIGDSSRSTLRRILEELTISGSNIDDIASVASLFTSVYKKGTTEVAGRQQTSAKLTYQYRMHPRIGNLVSELFYEKGLKSAESVTKKRKNQDRPFRLAGKLANVASPLVFVDTPYVADRRGAAERNPPYWNRAECEAVEQILKCIRTRGERTLSVAVLTPYNEQVSRLRRFLVSQAKRLFVSPEDLVRTIDSFQGNEADIVIGSLVRNNTRGYGKGLGILSDARRINVLISRAKWVLILVGSSRFLKTRVPAGRPITVDTDLYVLKQLYKKISDRRTFCYMPAQRFTAKRWRR